MKFMKVTYDKSPKLARGAETGAFSSQRMEWYSDKAENFRNGPVLHVVTYGMIQVAWAIRSLSWYDLGCSRVTWDSRPRSECKSKKWSQNQQCFLESKQWGMKEKSLLPKKVWKKACPVINKEALAWLFECWLGCHRRSLVSWETAERA